MIGRHPLARGPAGRHPAWFVGAAVLVLVWWWWPEPVSPPGPGRPAVLGDPRRPGGAPGSDGLATGASSLVAEPAGTATGQDRTRTMPGPVEVLVGPDARTVTASGTRVGPLSAGVAPGTGRIATSGGRSPAPADQVVGLADHLSGGASSGMSLASASPPNAAQALVVALADAVGSGSAASPVPDVVATGSAGDRLRPSMPARGERDQGEDRGSESGAERRGAPWQRFALGSARLIPGPAVNDILIASEAVWCATEQGLARAEPEQLRLVSQFPAPQANALVATPFGLWIATVEGAVLTTDAGVTFRLLSRPDGLVHEVLSCGVWDGSQLFLGSQAGFSRRRADGGFDKIDQTVTNRGLGASAISAMTTDGGMLYLGTNEGLYRWRTGAPPSVAEAWVMLPVAADGAPGQVTALAWWGRHLVVGTTRGLLQGDPRQWREARRFGPADGLPAGRVTALRAADDLLWVGTPAGLAAIDSTGEITGFPHTPLLALPVRALAIEADGHGPLLVGVDGGLVVVPGI